MCRSIDNVCKFQKRGHAPEKRLSRSTVCAQFHEHEHPSNTKKYPKHYGQNIHMPPTKQQSPIVGKSFQNIT